LPDGITVNGRDLPYLAMGNESFNHILDLVAGPDHHQSPIISKLCPIQPSLKI